MIHIRAMTHADIPLGMRLKSQAGWNQTEADWLRFLSLEPDGCFVAESQGRPVGTTTAAIFGDVAWIAMVLVDVDHRGRGIGTALFHHAIDFLDAQNVRAIRLDATDLGRPIYQKLGFESQFELSRFAGRLAEDYTSAAHLTPRPAAPADLAAIAAMDRTATRTDRTGLLQRLVSQHVSATHVTDHDNRITGYITSRPGSDAAQIGPCLANDPADGAALLSHALQQHAGRDVYVDIPKDHADAVSLIRRIGLQSRRTFIRMCRGEPTSERRPSLWASSGPEFG
ncbi:MAG: GNAT family N-acetyltransferase [Planctomycetaceae bacterium]|nr:GNAT family N-acetyltransferase [Planctomycetaceae bacterium]